MMHFDGCGTVEGVNTAGYSTTTLSADQATARGHAATPGDYYDGYPIIWVTKAAFATIGLQGNKKIKFLAKKPGEATQEDPHGLNSTGPRGLCLLRARFTSGRRSSSVRSHGRAWRRLPRSRSCRPARSRRRCPRR